jgi:hypothetical protein
MTFTTQGNGKTQGNGRIGICALMVIALALPAGAAKAATLAFSGTRTNVSPGGSPDGRCGPALTISFAPESFVASGTSNLGNFSYTASHCIAGPPPGPYYDGLFTWDFGADTLTGTYTGTLAALGPGLFGVTESILFSGGTGRFAGASGNALFTGEVSFGQFNGLPASFGSGSFDGSLTAPGIPEPASWAMMIAGFGIAGAVQRRRRAALA